MKPLFLLFVVLMLTFPFLAGCGGDAPKEQEQKVEETEASMEKGMEAMKNVKKPEN